MRSPIRVFLVDDSAVARALLRETLTLTNEIEIVGEATNGRDALVAIPRIRPDVVLMDVMMPGLDGVETTAALMESSPTPILVISDRATKDAGLGFGILEAGALDMIPKPTIAEMRDERIRSGVIRKIRVLAGVPVVTRRRARSPAAAAATRHDVRAVVPAAAPTEVDPAALVCIGASTGGPPAILRILRAIPAPAPVAVLIVQHMAPGFIEGMREWLQASTGHRTVIATHGSRAHPGTVHLAPDGHHLTLRQGAITLVPGAPRAIHCPSVNSLFESIAESDLAQRTTAVLLTGMGDDGARGLLALRRAGSVTIAQDRASSAVFGMPKSAIELGAASEILALDDIGDRIRQSFDGSMRRSRS